MYTSSDDLSSYNSEQLAEIIDRLTVASTTFANWAQTFVCSPSRILAPTTLLECRQILELAQRRGQRIRPVGVGHSPSDLACTQDWLIKMSGLRGLVSIDHEKGTATFRAGTTLHEVHSTLGRAEPPMALPNIGSISDQTIGGLISTASHGSGIDYPVLSQHVKSVKVALPLPGSPIVTASATQESALFTASLCGLGATGVLIDIEMEIEPAFRLREVKEAKRLEEVLDNLDEIKASAQHVRLWWYPASNGVVVGRADRTYEAAKPKFSWIEHLLAFHITQFLLLIAKIFPSFTTAVGRWAWWLASPRSEAVDEGYKILNFDCLFPQYALEWAIPSKNEKECIADLRDWLDREAAARDGLRPHFPIEIRWTAPDSIWLSPSFGRPTTWIGIVTYRPYGLPVPYRKLQSIFAQILGAHGGRPHWAKEHTLRPKAIADMYPRLPDYLKVVEKVDPQGLLRTENFRRHIQGEDIPDREFKSRPA